jgi:hypothetical protein
MGGHEFERSAESGAVRHAAADILVLRELVAALEADPDPACLIDQIDALERLKCAASATQARLTQHLATLRPSSHARSVSGEIGLARQESPHAARNLLTLATALPGMTRTADALAAGDLSEHRAQIIVNECEELEPADRELVDEAVPHMFLGLGDRRLREAVRELVLQLDDTVAARRHERAVARRRVTVRSIGDGMSILSAVLPSVRVPGILDSLEGEATRVKSAAPDDERSQAQRVLDVLAARLSGVPEGTPLPVATKVVVNVEQLTGAQGGAAVVGIGPIPEQEAFELILEGADHQLSTVQRLFVAPESGALVATERKGRFHPKELAEVIRMRDHQICRTPWCNAPVRHIDHSQPAARGGPTSASNGAGLCVTCNLAKEAVGWNHLASADDSGRHCVEVITPTGHRYRSREPGFPVPRVIPHSTFDLVVPKDFGTSA